MVSGNKAGGRGGGAYCAGANSSVTVKGIDFEGQEAGIWAGGGEVVSRGNGGACAGVDFCEVGWWGWGLSISLASVLTPMAWNPENNNNNNNNETVPRRNRHRKGGVQNKHEEYD